MGGRILVVDDEPYVLRIVSFKLRRAGFTAFEAASAEEALAVLEEHPVDLVLLDVGLATETDGFTFARQLRERPEHRDLPVILLTARGLADDVRRGRELGAAGYVTKPFSIDDLLGRVRALLAD